MKYIDRHNSWNGTVEIMWEVDHIKHVDGKVMFAFTKIGTYAVAAPEEIFFAESPNLLSAESPEDVTWTIFPETDRAFFSFFFSVYFCLCFLLVLASSASLSHLVCFTQWRQSFSISTDHSRSLYSSCCAFRRFVSWQVRC